VISLCQTRWGAAATTAAARRGTAAAAAVTRYEGSEALDTLEPLP